MALPAPPGGGAGVYKGKGPSNPGLKAIGHSSGYRGAGKYVAFSAPKAPPAAAGYNSPLYNPSQTLAGKQLNDAAQGIADAQTKGPLAALGQQIAQNNRQGAAAESQTMGYYKQLAQQAQDSLNKTQAIGSGLNSQLTQMGVRQAGAINGFGQQAQQGAVGQMAAQGLDGGAQAQLAAETARQQQLGAQNAGNFGAAGLVQGANYSQNAAQELGTNALRGQERLGNIAQATRLSNTPLSQKQASLIASRGALKATALGQLRTQERNYQVAQEGIGVKQASIGAQNARAAAQINAANQRSANSISAANARAAAALSGANWRAQLSSDTSLRRAAQGAAKGSGGRLSPAIQARFTGEIQSAYSQANKLKAMGYTPDQVRHIFTLGYYPSKNAKGQPTRVFLPKIAGGWNGTLANAGSNWALYGYANQNDVNTLHSMGYLVNGLFPTTAPAAPSIGQQVNGITGNLGGF
jgi:hypothetical protein